MGIYRCTSTGNRDTKTHRTKTFVIYYSWEAQSKEDLVDRLQKILPCHCISVWPTLSGTWSPGPGHLDQVPGGSWGLPEDPLGTLWGSTGQQPSVCCGKLSRCLRFCSRLYSCLMLCRICSAKKTKSPRDTSVSPSNCRIQTNHPLTPPVPTDTTARPLKTYVNRT